MTWVQTYKGHKFDFRDIQNSVIDLEDIAHSLSMQCRFNGHTKQFYSVADHSVNVSRTLPEEYALWGLLHDASEAYIGDLVRPLKQEMRHFTPFYDQIEAEIQRHIYDHFGLVGPEPEIVRTHDNAWLLFERDHLFLTPPPDVWGIELARDEDVASVKLPEKSPVMFSPEQSKLAFLWEFKMISERRKR